MHASSARWPVPGSVSGALLWNGDGESAAMGTVPLVHIHSQVPFTAIAHSSNAHSDAHS